MPFRRASRLLWLSGAALLTSVPTTLLAQVVATSCTVADSLLGPLDGKPDKFKAKYDDIEGVSRYRLSWDLNGASVVARRPVTVEWDAIHQGEGFHKPSFTLTADSEGFAQDWDAMSRLPFLIDDGERFVLETEDLNVGSVSLGNQGQKAIYQLTYDQVRRFVTAQSVRFRVAGREFTMERDQFHGLREFYRATMCHFPE